MIYKLQELNEKLINFYKNDEANLRKHILIQKILSDKKCFSKMKIEHAYAILRDLKIDEGAIKGLYIRLLDER